MRTVVRARAVIATSSELVRDGGFVVERGWIAAILRTHGSVKRASATARVLDLGDATLAPGLVNAHAHLELGALRGKLPRGPDFAAWVRRVVALRAGTGRRELAEAARRGADRALETGTTALGDVDTTGAAAVGLAGHPLRAWLYREALDAQDPGRTAAALAHVSGPRARGERRRDGLSPHAPFTVSPALFRALGRLAAKRRLPVTMHWSETRAEIEWLREGAGPLAKLLGPSPRTSGLDLLESAGLLRAPLSLVHGNHPARGEPERIARAGAVVVHCPHSHAWFEREPFPWKAYEARGVAVALGTDSLASNDDLDLRREMLRAREAMPRLAPAQVLDMATLAGARALGAERELGVLAPGFRADWVAYDGLGDDLGAALDALTSAEGAVRGAWIAGRRADSAARAARSR
jgi:cytosine/adenosine deaminase-related metal-dependent hydrolase